MHNDPASSAERAVLIFRNNLLNYSETFIPAQAEQFTTFTPHYIGFRRVPGIELPPSRTLPCASSKWTAKAREFGSVLGLVDSAFANNARKVRPELIHAHFEFGGINALPLAERLRIPLFVTCHGYDVTETNFPGKDKMVPASYYNARRKRLFEKASCFIAVSDFIRDQMVQRGYPAQKIRRHYIGVDTDFFQPDPAIEKSPSILFVGRLVHKKGCLDLLQATKIVNKRHPEITLNIVGDGYLREQLQAFAHAENLNVKFHGVQPPAVIHGLLKSALLLGMPSVRAETGDSEGLGIVNLEAQAVGIPVVGTRHGGIPEAVAHGITGLLTPERNPAALAESILTLLSDSALRHNMGVAARQRMVNHFDLKKQSQLLEKIYLEFL